MTFEIHNLPSGGLLFRGDLIQKKLTVKSHRQVVLCFPSTVADIDMLHTLLKSDDSELEDMEINDMDLYGHLALASISGHPLLIVGTKARTFIHFSQIRGLYDEEDLKSACSFALLTSHGKFGEIVTEYRFYCEKSMEYQKWVGAFSQAFQCMYGNSTEFEGEPVSTTGSTSSKTLTAMSRDPDDYVKAHRDLVNSRPAQRTPSNIKRTSITITRPEAFRSTTVSSTALSLSDTGSQGVAGPKKMSLFRKIKSVLSLKLNKSDFEQRGRESNQNIGSKIRSKSKSVAEMFSGKSEFQQRRGSPEKSN